MLKIQLLSFARQMPERLASIALLVAILLLGYNIIPKFDLTRPDPYNTTEIVDFNYAKAVLNRALAITLTSDTHDVNSASSPSIPNDATRVESPLVTAAKLISFKDAHSIYLLWCYSVHIIFLLGIFAFYSALTETLNSRIYGIFGVLLVLCSPRIYGESFYNIIDTGLISISMFVLLLITKICGQRDFIYIVFFSFLSGLLFAFNLVCVSLIPALVFILFWKLLHNSITTRQFILYIGFATIISFLVSTPFLFNRLEPLQTIDISDLDDLHVSSPTNWILFRGAYFSANNIPREYLPTWILITTPLAVLALFGVGFLHSCHKLYNPKLTLEIGPQYLPVLVIQGLISALTISYATLSKPTLQEADHYYYFIYPSLVYIGVFGWATIWGAGKHKIIRCGLIVVLLTHIITTTHWMYWNLPLWNTYFNRLAKNVGIKYQRYSSGLSLMLGLNYLARNTDGGAVSVIGYSSAQIKYRLQFLPNQYREKLIATSEMDTAKYIIFDYNVHNPLDLAVFMALRQYKQIVYEIYVDDFTVLTILSN